MRWVEVLWYCREVMGLGLGGSGVPLEGEDPDFVMSVLRVDGLGRRGVVKLTSFCFGR